MAWQQPRVSTLHADADCPLCLLLALQLKGTSTLSTEQTAGFFIAGFFLALLPAYLYHSVFDLSVTENAPVYLLVTLAAAAMLTLAYRNVEAGTHFFLAASRKTGRYAAAKSQTDTDNLVSQESLSWSAQLQRSLHGVWSRCICRESTVDAPAMLLSHCLLCRALLCTLCRCLGRSFFLNNALFAAFFLFLAFYALKSIDTLFNYVLSVLIAALATWQLSNGSAPR